MAIVCRPILGQTNLETSILGCLSWSSSNLKVVENAGRSFMKHSHLLHHGQTQHSIDSVSDDDESDDETHSFPELTPENVGDFNYYEIMGLEKNGLGVSPEKLKRAYRRALLNYHPDKTGRGDQDAVFMAVQKAYETLGDLKKKRAYDSVLDFDDSIPTGDEPGDFFEIFGPVFAMNARFSKKQPVPKLGNDKTSMDKVYDFYSFWTKFESWRDFSLEAQEYNLDEADGRMEKRWMMKENERIAKGLKKEEYQRLVDLVERARAKDPRLKRAKEEEKAAKEAAKQAKIAERKRKEEERRLVEEEKKRLEEEREARLKEEQRGAKLLRDQMKKELRKAKKQVKTKIVEKGFLFNEDDLELFFGNADLDIMNAAAEVVDTPDGLEAITGLVNRIKSEHKETERKRQEEIKARAQKETEKEEKERQRKAHQTAWSEEEISMLAKAVQKFPAGSQNRWMTISNFMAHMLHVDRSKEECIAKYQEIQQAPGQGMKRSGKAKPAAPAAAPPSADGTAEDWTQQQQQALEEALQRFPASMDKNERWKSIAASVSGKTKKECIARYKTLRAAVLAKKK
mmetsp:Transcript_12627/g.16281  ORF Transcript_12627/g.16281 Transcript_12627/m.16281 type:complete len:570 (+) Transcript_12627:24-1733(+)